MKNDKNPLMESFINDLLDILLDEEKSDLFSENDIVGVKTVMAESYFDKVDVLNKIADTEEFRQKFGSNKLVSNLINDLNKIDNDNIDFDFLNQRLVSINLFEEKYFSNISYGTALKHILELVKKLKIKYSQTKPKEEDEQILFSNLFNLYKRTIEEITINNSNSSNFQQLYNEIKTAFSGNNYRDADIYFKYHYLYPFNLKDNIISEHDANNVIVNYLNSRNSAANIKVTLSKVVEIKKFFENPAFRDIILNKAKTQEEYAITFYSYFDEIKKQELIEQWVPLNGNKDYNIFENILEKIQYDIPEVDKLALKFLNTTGRSNLIDERKKLFDLLFKLELTNDFDYSTYSQQIITNICSTNIDYHKLGINQLKEHRNRVVEFNLKTGCEQALLNNFLPNVAQYHLQITNLLSIDIGMKRVLNDAIKDNPNFINSTVNYLMTANSSSFFKILKPNLFKNNYLLISKQFLNNSANQLRNNKALINNYKGILNMQLSKYFKDLELEFKNLVDNYNLNLNQEKDKIIMDIEDMLNN